jgi:hypothetical protein
MDRSRTPPFTKKVLLQSKRLFSDLRITRRPRGDGEERERLVVGESLVEQTLNRRSLSPRLGVMSLPTSDLDDATLLQRYAQIARETLSSPPLPCFLLSPKDVELMDEQPVAAGGSADILKARHDGCEVVLKAYRHNRSCDITQVVVVRRDHL